LRAAAPAPADPAQLAAEVAFTGAPLDAQVSGALGLVNRVVPAEQVLDTALELAANASLAVQASKRTMMRSLDTGSDWSGAAWAMNEGRVPSGPRNRDAREGATAFAEKRRPERQGV
jgi:crotonobetainyl-CoA hydratase